MDYKQLRFSQQKDIARFLSQSALRFFLMIAIFVGPAHAKQNDKQESPAEIRQIVAQSLCLIEGYPLSQVSKDAQAVLSAYIDALGPKFDHESLPKLRELAKAAKPSAPTKMGQHNFAIAKCVLFSHQKDVQTLLGN